MPKVSVILPAYNAEKYIKEAIDSILSQTFQDFELLVLNDCSKDRTEEIIRSYADERIVYLKNEKNMGVAATLNKGLAAAKGEYVARMDADDISLPERFARQVEYLDAHPAVAVVGSALEIFGEDVPGEIRRFSENPKQMKVDLLFSSGLAHPSVMIRRSVIRDLGGYDLEFEGLEDYELWCRVARHHELSALPEILFRYRVHGSQVTRNPSEKYLTRMRRLKQRQLQELAMAVDTEVAESYYGDIWAAKIENLQSAQRLIGLLTAVLEANDKAAVYDAKVLRGNFKALAIKAALQLTAKDAAQLCKQCDLFSCWDLRVQKMRNRINRQTVLAYCSHFSRKMINRRNRGRLKNKDFTLLSSNCNGACICHDLGLEFRSPFVNLFLNAQDYLKLLGAPKEYLEKKLEFVNNAGVDYPVAMLGDVTLHFMHYKSENEAQEAWCRRKERMNWENLFVLMSDKDGCNEEILRAFDALPYKNKVVFTHVPHPQIGSAVYIPGFEKEQEVGNCDAFIKPGSGKKYYDAFDYVTWFNNGQGQSV